MRKDLQEKLENEFSFMKRDKTKTPTIYQQWSCECGSGWFDLLFSLFTEVSEVYAKAGVEPDITIQQIKEKFGTLRVYASFSSSSCNLHAIDFLNIGTGIRFVPEHDTGDDTLNTVHKEVMNIIKNYEEKSRHTCEVCSAEGILRLELPWKQVLCDGCLKDYYDKKAQRQLEKKRLIDKFKDNS